MHSPRRFCAILALIFGWTALAGPVRAEPQAFTHGGDRFLAGDAVSVGGPIFGRMIGKALDAPESGKTPIAKQ